MPLYPLAGLCHLLACTFLVFVVNSSADIHFLRYGAFCNGWIKVMICCITCDDLLYYVNVH